MYHGTNNFSHNENSLVHYPQTKSDKEEIKHISTNPTDSIPVDLKSNLLNESERLYDVYNQSPPFGSISSMESSIPNFPKRLKEEYEEDKQGATLLRETISDFVDVCNEKIETAKKRFSESVGAVYVKPDITMSTIESESSKGEESILESVKAETIYPIW